MDIRRAFSLNAAAYNEVNIIQNCIIEQMLKKIQNRPMRILDIGCGRGGVYEHLPYRTDCFVGMDFAEGMLALHPQNEEVILLHRDFNQPDAFDDIHRYDIERIVSASALQWADDLDAVLGRIALLNIPATLALFTSETFRTLYEIGGMPPLLRSTNQTKALLTKHFDGEIETLRYKLYFNSVREMFRYMKRSGVSAHRNILGYKEMKMIMKRYPVRYLEYEIVLLHTEG